jgi:hypothetical protein
MKKPPIYDDPPDNTTSHANRHSDPATALTPLNAWTLQECREEHPALVGRVEQILKQYHEDREWARDKERIAGTGRYAKTAVKTGIPLLKPNQIPRYIGAVARAVAEARITAAQGNGLLYAAQTLISAARSTVPPPPHSIGFKKGPRK